MDNITNMLRRLVRFVSIPNKGERPVGHFNLNQSEGGANVFQSPIRGNVRLDLLIGIIGSKCGQRVSIPNKGERPVGRIIGISPLEGQ